MIRYVNFVYNASYFQVLANTAQYLALQGLEPNEDFTFRDNGHVLEIDSNAHFNIKECEEWQQLLEEYEEVGCLYLREF